MPDDKLAQDRHLAEACCTLQRQEIQRFGQGYSKYSNPGRLQQDEQPEVELTWPVTKLSWVGGLD